MSQFVTEVARLIDSESVPLDPAKLDREIENRTGVFNAAAVVHVESSSSQGPCSRSSPSLSTVQIGGRLLPRTSWESFRRSTRPFEGRLPLRRLFSMRHKSG